MKKFIFVVLTLFMSAAPAANLTEFEQQIFTRMIQFPEQEEELKAIYFLDIETQILAIQPLLPIQVGRSTMFRVDLSPGPVIEYHYQTSVMSEEDIPSDANEQFEKITRELCQDEQTAFFTAVMGGELHFKYWTADKQVMFAVHTLSGNDCGGSI